MKAFAALLDALAFQPQRSLKIRLIADYFRRTGDPARGYALAALTGTIVFDHAKPALLRALIAERVDGALFVLSYDYVGDLAETVSLLWPAGEGEGPSPGLAEVVGALRTASKARLPQVLADLLGSLQVAERYALLKLVTGGFRVGVSARLAKAAFAGAFAVALDEVEEVWHGQEPPYTELFAWAEGRAPRPAERKGAHFRPVMLAHALEEGDFAAMNPHDFLAEWKWDGIRVQAQSQAENWTLFSRSGDDITASFPELRALLGQDAVIDGELVILRAGRVAPFADLQKRLSRKTVSPRMIETHPAAVIAYDVLLHGGEDLRALPFAVRRARLEAAVSGGDARLLISPLVPFESFEALARLRAACETPLGPAEGVMLKRRASPYLAGRVKGHWYKWKRDPFLIDAVLLYAQRGHGKRSSFYSDYTFGVWRGDELVPVGKAYFGFTDAELKKIDAFVRTHTVNRFGPVREVMHERDEGLVLEVAFEGLQRSPRHKSGLAMRFPRISRLRWDKRPHEADTLEALARLLPAQETPSP